MKRTTKSILGLLGLATVAALTIVAAGIENPANATTTGDVNVSYTVIDEGRTSQTVELPKHNMKTVDSVIPVKVIYSDTETIKYSITYTDSDGVTQTINLPDYTAPDYSGGVHEWSFDLGELGLGYGTYVFHVDVYGNGRSSDSIEFSYQAVKIEPVTATDDGGNPTTADDGSIDLSIFVASKEASDHGDIKIYNPDSTPAINPATGQPIVIPIDPNDIAAGLIHLDLGSYGLANNQSYLIVATIYDVENNIIGSDSLTISYYAATIDVPNTGGSVFSALNLSNSDFIISSSIAFFAITILALVVIKKSNKKDSRRR